jgi:ribonuclease HI
MNDDPVPRRLRIYQQNVMKTIASAMHLINLPGLHDDYDFVALQEPYIDFLSNARANRNWRVIYPSTKGANKNPIRSVIFVNAKLNTDYWHQLEFPSNDVTVVQTCGDFGRVTLINIYNDGDHSHTLDKLRRFLRTRRADIMSKQNDYVIWLGDYNRHHALWELERNSHLCDGAGERAAQPLIDLLADFDMVMPLPAGLHTLQHKANHSVLTRPDNVFCTPNAEHLIVQCDVLYDRQGPGADHFPISTILDLPMAAAPPPPPRRDFRAVNWDDFRKALELKISARAPVELTSGANLRRAVQELDDDIDATIAELVPLKKRIPWRKRWWCKELSQLRSLERKGSRYAYRYRYVPDHVSHLELRQIRRTYTDAIKAAKLKHWEAYLSNLEPNDVWTATRFTTGTGTDGGGTRVPTLKTADGVHATNEEKAHAFSKTFFPPAPTTSSVPPRYNYPTPCADLPDISTEQIERAIKKLSPHKAPGPDGVPNVVYKECVAILAQILRDILQACIDLDEWIVKWLLSMIAAVRKPGRSDYSFPGSYRPISLKNGIPKIYTSVMSELLMYYAEKFSLLPKNHFGGRAGRTTTDALHLLVSKIRDAWSRDKMVGVLYLDVEAAFPNAVPAQLIHNLKKRQVPTKLVRFIERILVGRQTKLRFDDFESAPFALDNGIDQGCPLSLALYLFYNGDFLDIPRDSNEDGTLFVDDSKVIVIGDDQTDLRMRVESFMHRRKGGFEWFTTHNSTVSLDKTKWVIYTRDREPILSPRTRGSPSTRPVQRIHITLRGKRIDPSPFAKYLGVLVDQELRWKEQETRAAKTAMKWTLATRRLAKVNKGVSPSLMRRLYLSICIPKMLYAADVWMLLPSRSANTGRYTGSVMAIRKLASAQRVAALAITGALRSTATDALDAHANLLPVTLLVRKHAFDAALRLATLADGHPLYPIVKHISVRNRQKQRSQIHKLLAAFPEVDPRRMEKIPAIGREPWGPAALSAVVPSTREDAIADAKDIPDSHAYRLYTDGSGYEGHAGAAAVLLRYQEHIATLRFHLGPLTEHTVHEAEGVALTMGLHLLWQQQNLRGNIDIGIDNQAIITGVGRLRHGAGSHIISRAQDQADALVARYDRRNIRGQIRVRWTPGHEGIHGNDLADQAAKDAAEGNQCSEERHLPRYLRRPEGLPMNKSAVRQEFLSKLHDEWKDEWAVSPRYPRINAIDTSLPSASFLKLVDGCTRAQSSLLIQLRTGRIALNRHLYKLSKIATPQCPHCPHEEETVRHVLFDCPSYRQARLPFRRALRRRAHDLGYILTSKSAQKPLFTFMHATGRFRNVYGDELIPARNGEQAH